MDPNSILAASNDPVMSHSIGEAIELSLAPVFLLVAIGSMLNVITQRLARAVDRARRLEEDIQTKGLDPEASREAIELIALGRRILYANWSINFSAITALFISFLVALIFISDMARIDSSRAIAVLFILAMTTFVLGLCAFLVEIYVATRTLRVGRVGRTGRPAKPQAGAQRS